MWIEFSEFNIKLLLPLIFPIFKRVQDYTKKTYLTKDNQLFKTFRYFMSYMFSIIPFLIIKIRTKNTKEIEKSTELNKENINEKGIIETRTLSVVKGIIETRTISVVNYGLTNEITELKKKNDKKRTIYNIIFLFILCIMGLFCYLFRWLFELEEFSEPKQSIGIFFEIFDYALLSYFILKQKLYKHHFVSAGIIAVLLIILFIITIPYRKNNKFFLSIVYFFFYSLCFGSYDILGKKYMIKYFITPYFFMFIVGFIDVIFLLIYELFSYFLNPSISGITFGFRNNINKVGDVFLFILDLIVEDIWNLGIWLTVYYLTPCHYFISEYISEYVYYMIEARQKKDTNKFYSTTNVVIFSICYFINFLCCLIFNEVFILNFCGLDYNTRKRINQRISKEKTDLIDSQNLIEMGTEKDEDESNEVNID